MPHPHARLTPFGRLLLIQRVETLGWPVCRAAASMGVSRQTAYKWLARWRLEGSPGLRSRSARPHTSPRALPEPKVQEILTLRRQLRVGPHRLAPLVGSPRSTIYKVLRQRGLSRLRNLDRSTGVPIRYVRERPGELLHIDMKPLGRVPTGGGARILGKARADRHQERGYEIVHVAVDDASRLAFVQVLPDSRGPTAARFLLDAAVFFAEHGIQIERAMTDRSPSYTLSKTFQRALHTLQTRHKVTRPYRPQTNGKAERFIQTLLAEWAYATLYTSNQERLEALPKWLHYYNHERPHTALGGRTPVSRAVNNVCGNHN